MVLEVRMLWILHVNKLHVYTMSLVVIFNLRYTSFGAPIQASMSLAQWMLSFSGSGWNEKKLTFTSSLLQLE
jgi:hypothetical protein